MLYEKINNLYLLKKPSKVIANIFQNHIATDFKEYKNKYKPILKKILDKIGDVKNHSSKDLQKTFYGTLIELKNLNKPSTNL